MLEPRCLTSFGNRQSRETSLETLVSQDSVPLRWTHLRAPPLSSWKENLPHSKLVFIVWTEVLWESRQGEQMFNEVCEGGGWLQAVWESKPLTDV